ncbi:MAG: HEAT repeat domain-containing protein [Planctomycetes bacterium]|nr:HEAT repeat domain-containing protein [Planctomycetota bacterium]
MKTKTTTCETPSLRAPRGSTLLYCAWALALAFATNAACAGEVAPNPAARHEPTRFGKTAAQWLAVIENGGPISMDPIVAALALSQFGPEAGDAIEAAARASVLRYAKVSQDGKNLTDDAVLKEQFGLMVRLGVMGRAFACDPETMYARTFAIIAAAGAGESKEDMLGILGGGLLLKGMMELPGSQRYLSKGIAQGFRHPDPQVRAFCQQTLGSIEALVHQFGAGREITLLRADDARALLAGGERYAQLSAAGVLYRLGEDKKALEPLLLRAFKDGEDPEAFLAVQLVEALGPGAAPVAEAFASWLAKREDDNGMIPVLNAAYALGPAARACAPRVRRIAESGSPFVVGKALLALARIAPPGDAGIAVFLDRKLGGDEGGDEAILAGALYKGDAKALAACAFGLLEKDTDAETDVIRALRPLQDETRRLVLERIGSDKERVRRAAIQAARALRAPDAELVKLLGERLDAGGLEGLEAIETLEGYGAAAAPAIPFVEKALAKKEPDSAEALVELLKTIGRPAVSALAAAVANADDECSGAALKALRELEAEAVGARGAVLKKLEQSGDTALKIVCLGALSAMGPADEPTRAAVVKAAQSPILPLRIAACDALRWTGCDPSPYWTLKEETPEARRARLKDLDETTLVSQIEYGTPENRTDGIAELSARGQLDPLNVYKLVNQLRKAPAEERAAVRALLLKVGAPAVKPLAEFLAPPNHWGRPVGAGGRLRRAVKPVRSVKEWTELLDPAQPPALRAEAAEALGEYGQGEYGEEAASAVGALVAAAREEDDFLAAKALEALGKIGVQNEAAIAIAKESFDNAKRVDAAAVALKALGGDPKPLLAARLDRPLDELAVRCAGQLVKLDPKHARARAVLIQGRDACTVGCTPPAVEALLALEETKPGTLEWMIGRLVDAGVEREDPRWWGFVFAKRELKNLREAALPAVAAHLASDANPKIRAECAGMLTCFDPPMEAALFKLPVAFKDADAGVRRSAVAGVQKLLEKKYVPRDRDARPLLLPLAPDFAPLVTDAVYETRLAAVTVLGLIRPAGDVGVPPLAQGLKDERAEVRAAAAHALGLLDLKDDAKARAQALDALAGVLGDGDAKVQREAALVAARLDAKLPALAQAATALIALLEDKDTDWGDKHRLYTSLQGVGAPAVGPLFDAVMRKFDSQK